MGPNDARQLLDKFVEFIRIGLNQETRSYLAEHSRLYLQPRVWPQNAHHTPTFKLYFHEERFNTLGTGDGYNRSRRGSFVAVPCFLTTGPIRVTAKLRQRVCQRVV